MNYELFLVPLHLNMKKGLLRNYGLLLLAVLLLVACSKGEKAEEKKPSKRERAFRAEVMLKTTPVKDQGASSLCWVYAMLATIETEHIMRGDSVNLSPDFVARAFLREQYMERCMAKKLMDDNPEAEVTTRGTMPMLVKLIQTYGLTHYDAYHRRKDCNYNVLCRKLNQETATNLRLHQFTDVQNNIEKQLDEAIGPAPRFVFMLGAEYTPIEFAHSVCRADEYVAMTSFTHHPFGQRFPLEIADNRYHDVFLNVPMDSLVMVMDSLLRSGHPVCWEGDTSEPGFQWKKGVATLGQRKTAVTQEERQQGFENHTTTDDHCMAVVGIARDKRGKKFYVMKNSWGAANAFGGFIFVSEDYVRLKTIAIMVPESLK